MTPVYINMMCVCGCRTAGLKLINLMGSHGTKAVAAAVLGARATCVDISPVNAAFCAKVAAAAGVHVEFVVADVLHLPPEHLTGKLERRSSTGAQKSMSQGIWVQGANDGPCVCGECGASHIEVPKRLAYNLLAAYRLSM